MNISSSFFSERRAQCYFDRKGSVQMEFWLESVIYQLRCCVMEGVEKYFKIE